MSVSSTITTSAANTTKYLAGGSGDNIIADGYIKTVEKVWLDSYTIAFTNTLTCIQIADLPENKKITSIVVEILTTASQSSGTVSIGYVEDTTDILATTGVADFLAPFTLTHNLTRTSISLPGGLLNSVNYTGAGLTIVPMAFNGFQAVTGGTQTTIGIKLNNWTMTSGTIKTIVRYT
jgi:hypothetical protein